MIYACPIIKEETRLKIEEAKQNNLLCLKCNRPFNSIQAFKYHSKIGCKFLNKKPGREINTNTELDTKLQVFVEKLQKETKANESNMTVMIQHVEQVQKEPKLNETVMIQPVDPQIVCSEASTTDPVDIGECDQGRSDGVPLGDE